jgi:hypothetical protein
MQVKMYILHAYITYIVRLHHVRTQNFLLAGADLDAVHNLYLILKIVL